MSTPFWIAHHPEEQRCRCVRLCGLDICARCLGLYPLLFALLCVEMAVRAPGPRPFEVWILAALTMPALFDWARGRFEPQSGSNALRIATGALLACALARTIWFHMIQPFHLVSCAHLMWLVLTAAFVEIAAVRHRRQAILAASPEAREFASRSVEELLAGKELPDEVIGGIASGKPLNLVNEGARTEASDGMPPVSMPQELPAAASAGAGKDGRAPSAPVQPKGA